MRTKKYASLAIALATLLSVAIAVPVLAAGENPQGSTQYGDQPKFMGVGKGRGAAFGILGSVVSVNGTTLTVTARPGFRMSTTTTTSTQTSYTVDASNAKIMKGNATSTVSGIAVGDVVMVQGTINGASIAATMIRDAQMPNPKAKGAKAENNRGKNTTSTPLFVGNGQPIVAGTVSSLGVSTLTVTNKSNVVYTVNTSGATILKGNATATIGDVSVGDAIVVQGVVNGTSINASTIIDQKKPGEATSTNAGAESNKPAEVSHQNIFKQIGGFFMHLFGF